MPAGVNDWGQAIFLSLSNAINQFLQAIPLVIGAIVVLIIGWIVSNVLASLTETVLRRAGADRLYAIHGTELYGDAVRSWPPSRIGAEIVRWVVRIVALLMATNTLGWDQVTILLNQIILWIPNLVVAAIILLVAPLIGRFVGGAIATGATSMGFTNGGILGQLANWAVIAFAVVVAVNQVGVAQNLIDILFVGIVGALALAFGLAFGLGGRDVAGELTRDWYQASRSRASQAGEHLSTSQGRRASARRTADEPPELGQPAGGLPAGARGRPE